MIIREIFDQPYPLTWDEKWAPQEISARAKTRVGDLKVTFLQFYSRGVTAIEFGIGSGFELTGKGDEIAIFATVKHAIAEYLKKYGRPAFFLITSKGKKRTKTYASLIRRYALGLGYKIADPNDLPEEALKNLGDSIQHDDFFILGDTQQKLTEIAPIGTSDVHIAFNPNILTRRQLGKTFGKLHNGFSYNIMQGFRNISIYYSDMPDEYQEVAYLVTEPAGYLIPKARRVGVIAVHPQFRRQGLATALYEIYFKKIGRYLLAGDKQSPGGRRNWVSLANNPNIEITGLLGIDSDQFNVDPSSYYGVSTREHNALWDKLMDLGAEYLKETDTFRWFLVPVKNMGQQLDVLKHFHLYRSGASLSDGVYVDLLAQWRGGK